MACGFMMCLMRYLVGCGVCRCLQIVDCAFCVWCLFSAVIVLLWAANGCALLLVSLRVVLRLFRCVGL